MDILRKKTRFLFFMFFVMHTTFFKALDFITILTPLNASTVSGQPLLVTGASSQPNTRVRVIINTTEIESVTTNILGNWSLSSNDIRNGSYTVTADLMDINGVILATDTHSFTVSDQYIYIASPVDGDVVGTNPLTISGISSAATTTVNVSVDGNLAATTTTDSAGNWSAPCTFTTNGAHTILAELIVSLLPVASSSIGVTSSIPVFFATGITKMRIVGGSVPITGSGSGSGYSYSNSGSITTITFSPAFPAVPIVVATGRRSSGSSTITVASVSASAASLLFSSGTTAIQFSAILFS